MVYFLRHCLLLHFSYLCFRECSSFGRVRYSPISIFGNAWSPITIDLESKFEIRHLQFWANVDGHGSMSGILTLNSSFRDSHSAVVQVCFWVASGCVQVGATAVGDATKNYFWEFSGYVQVVAMTLGENSKNCSSFFVWHTAVCRLGPQH